MFNTYKNKKIKSARFSYLDVKLIVLKLWIEQEHDWTWQWTSDSFAFKKTDEILHNCHALLIEVCARDVCSNNVFLIIDRLVKFGHLLDILSIENEFWAGRSIPFILTIRFLSDCHWETVGNVNHFSIDCAQKCADNH